MSSDSPESTKPIFPEPQHFPETQNVLMEPEVEIAPQGSYEPEDISVPVAPPEPIPHVEHSYIPSHFACVRCGSTNLARGFIVDYGGEKFEQVRFAPRRISLKWLNSLFNLRPWRGLLKLEAVACRDCGAVLMTVDPDDLRRAERRRDY